MDQWVDLTPLYVLKGVCRGRSCSAWPKHGGVPTRHYLRWFACGSGCMFKPGGLGCTVKVSARLNEGVAMVFERLLTPRPT